MRKSNIGPTILWIYIILALIAAMTNGIKILLIFLGAALILFGFLNIFSRRIDESVRKFFGESEIDKKLFSEKDRYLTRRYFSSFSMIIIGIILIWIFSWLR